MVPKGGQNVLEPAKLDCAILCGPHTTNFARMAADMTALGALRQLAGPADLVPAIAELQVDDVKRGEMIAAARNFAEDQAGVLDRTMVALTPLLQAAAAASP
jgi:3-deoxy-D-manno-octulosonic-acid transferase